MTEQPSHPADSVQICGYLPGAIGRITELHGVYYTQQQNLDTRFEAQVASELSTFLLGFDPQQDGFWTVVKNGVILGSIAIDSHGSALESPTPDEQPDPKEKAARLRWFILAPECHGQGLGRLLMREAIEFCRKKGFHSIYLWTFAGLDAARRVYEAFGFQLQYEHESNAWGRVVKRQRFVLDLRN